MRYLRLFWPSTILLAVVCFWQFVEIRDLRNQQATEPLDTSVTERYQELTSAIQQQRVELQALEATALDSDRELISWLTVQADAVGVSIIGTSQLPPRAEGIYRLTSSQVEVEGSYDALIRFVRRLERDRPVVRVDSMRFFTRRSAPEVPLLRLILSSLYGEKGTSGSVERSNVATLNEAPNPQPEIRNPQSQIRNPKSAIPNPKSLTRNPFVLPTRFATRKASAAEAEPVWPELKAILWDERTPAAIVSLAGRSRTLSAGGFVGQVQVERIEPNQVLFRQGTDIRTVELWPSLETVSAFPCSRVDEFSSAPTRNPGSGSDELGRMPGRSR